MNWLDKLESFWRRCAWMCSVWCVKKYWRTRDYRDLVDLDWRGPMAWPTMQVSFADNCDVQLILAFPLFGRLFLNINCGLVKRFPWLSRKSYCHDRVFGFYSCASHILFYWNGSNYGSGGPDCGRQWFLGWETLFGGRKIWTSEWEDFTNYDVTFPPSESHNLAAVTANMLVKKRTVYHRIGFLPTCEWVQWDFSVAQGSPDIEMWDREDGVYKFHSQTYGGYTSWGEAADVLARHIQKKRD